MDQIALSFSGLKAKQMLGGGAVASFSSIHKARRERLGARTIVRAGRGFSTAGHLGVVAARRRHLGFGWRIGLIQHVLQRLTSGRDFCWGSARAIAVAAEADSETYVGRSANRSILIPRMNRPEDHAAFAEKLFDHGGMAFGIVPSRQQRTFSLLAGPRGMKRRARMRARARGRCGSAREVVIVRAARR